MNSFISDFLTIKRASQEFKDHGMSESWFYKERTKGRIPFYKPAGRVYVRRSDLERFILDSEEKTTNRIEREVEQLLITR